jgi:hypothetical protein
MLKYKLLKDLPFAKAGEIFREDYDENDNNNVYLFQESYEIKQHKILVEDIDDFDNWFEEVRTFGEYYYVIDVGHVGYLEDGSYRPNDTLGRMEIGNIFKTREEAEKYLEYLKAKEVIKQDANDFKPDWNDENDRKYCGFWDITKKEFEYMCINTLQSDSIYFNIADDIIESFEKHPEEWKTYLTYDQ